tara:strand:- start:1250 stop:1576 length:327 start_codon:yes stop_codon:yes gene_type:complete
MGMIGEGLYRKIVTGGMKAEEGRVKASGLRASSLRAARDYSEALDCAFMVVSGLERLLAGPKVEHKQDFNTKITMPAPWYSKDANLIVIFTIEENPEPVSAWVEEGEL